jgi:hypothetical protein
MVLAAKEGETATLGRLLERLTRVRNFGGNSVDAIKCK